MSARNGVTTVTVDAMVGVVVAPFMLPNRHMGQVVTEPDAIVVAGAGKLGTPDNVPMQAL